MKTRLCQRLREKCEPGLSPSLVRLCTNKRRCFFICFNVKKEDLQKSYDEEDTRDLRYSLYDGQDIEMVIGNSVTSSTSAQSLTEEQDQKGKMSRKEKGSRISRRTNRRFKSLSSLVHVFRTSTSEEKIRSVIKVENEKRCMQELLSFLLDSSQLTISLLKRSCMTDT